MRKFCSYGTANKKLHYYVPRQALVDYACQQLVGDDPDEGGHYITVWAPRQRGKSWVMREVLWRLQKDARFDVLKINLEHLKRVTDVDKIIHILTREISESLNQDVSASTLDEFYTVFKKNRLDRPLILILDEFDSLYEEAISALVGGFRNIYNARQDSAAPTAEKPYLLHGVALIGVRSVLGIGNQRGSPFNIQRSIHIPNLTEAEVQALFHWYERESGQVVEPAVIARVFYETQGQPGLVSWLGELLTEDYNATPEQPFTLAQFDRVYSFAINVLPNNNILNIVDKAQQAPYQETVLDLFRTQEKQLFTYDDPHLNFLYLNGVVDWEKGDATQYLKFACPLVQKRLFNYFARTLFRYIGTLYPPFMVLDTLITATHLNIAQLLQQYALYLRKNRGWLLKDAPRRADLRVCEAVYHFNLYMYLDKFMRQHGGQIWPEFPTGNGKIDLIIRYAGQVYGIEVKSFSTDHQYKKALEQAAGYGRSLGLNEITLALFIDVPVDDANRAKYEAVYVDADTGVTVTPVFVEIGAG